MKIKIFGKPECAKCQTTKNKFEHFLTKWNYTDKVKLHFHDMNTVEGMAEGAYYDVLKIPTTVLEKDSTQIARWEGEIPNSHEVKVHLEKVLSGN